jgi:hypothetical protein
VVNVNLNGIAVDFIASAVKLLFPLFARHHAPGAEHQAVQQIELTG